MSTDLFSGYAIAYVETDGVEADKEASERRTGKIKQKLWKWKRRVMGIWLIALFVPGFDVIRVEDTNGAGDSFWGGFLYKISVSEKQPSELFSQYL